MASLGDIWRAGWPALVAILAATALYWVGKIIFSRGCWRCQTPVLPAKRRSKMLGFLPLVRCDRCGAWRGYIFRS